MSFIPIALSRLTQFTPSTSNPNTTHQDDLAEMFLKLCVDETPIVRKVAAQHLGQVTKDLMNLIANTSAGANVAQGTIPSNVLKAFAALANDDQVSYEVVSILCLSWNASECLVARNIDLRCSVSHRYNCISISMVFRIL